MVLYHQMQETDNNRFESKQYCHFCASDGAYLQSLQCSLFKIHCFIYEAFVWIRMKPANVKNLEVHVVLYILKMASVKFLWQITFSWALFTIAKKFQIGEVYNSVFSIVVRYHVFILPKYRLGDVVILPKI